MGNLLGMREQRKKVFRELLRVYYIRLSSGTILLLLLTGVYYFNTTQKETTENLVAVLPSVSQQQQVRIVKTLLEKVGPIETQEVLVKSGLPFTGETHLVFHAVGDYNYERHGSEALFYCKDYFLSACYHGVIINELADHGIRGVREDLSQCKKRSINTFFQCGHAAGHGFLAWVNYDLLQALSLCDEFDDIEKGQLSLHCHAGVFMENIYGVHNGGPIKNNPWLSDADPYFPCNSVPEKYTSGCWLNQATRMYEMFQGNFQKVAEGCDGVENPQHQEECYNNFARQIQPLTQGRFDVGSEFCQIATGQKWQDHCLSTLAVSTMSLGDYDQASYRLCDEINSGEMQKACYYQLSDYIRNSAFSEKERRSICSNIQDSDVLRHCLR